MLLNSGSEVSFITCAATEQCKLNSYRLKESPRPLCCCPPFGFVAPTWTNSGGSLVCPEAGVVVPVEIGTVTLIGEEAKTTTAGDVPGTNPMIMMDDRAAEITGAVAGAWLRIGQ
ncbi:hypothetical protein HaLaN_02959 [Haematococcus lacustris]|uniref:Uncharacterized protein n=1 Tax=Haematococcus lacustris TaxID=44745 RepID=A0A699YD92_HAELA|nr:hypothetical protein HaLaN_02959 [Haematococcus lacustris]